MLKDKIKKIIAKKTNGNNKKTIENLVVFLVLLIITIISINLIWGNNEEIKEKEIIDSNYKTLATQKNIESNISQIEEYNLEDELENILTKISGVGKVQVLVTYSQTSEVVAMSNDTINISKTEETDSNRWNKKNRIYKSKQRNNS